VVAGDAPAVEVTGGSAVTAAFFISVFSIPALVLRRGTIWHVVWEFALFSVHFSLSFLRTEARKYQAMLRVGTGYRAKALLNLDEWSA
jgi:hypothetical protein